MFLKMKKTTRILLTRSWCLLNSSFLIAKWCLLTSSFSIAKTIRRAAGGNAKTIWNHWWAVLCLPPHVYRMFRLVLSSSPETNHDQWQWFSSLCKCCSMLLQMDALSAALTWTLSFMLFIFLPSRIWYWPCLHHILIHFPRQTFSHKYFVAWKLQLLFKNLQWFSNSKVIHFDQPLPIQVS